MVESLLLTCYARQSCRGMLLALLVAGCGGEGNDGQASGPQGTPIPLESIQGQAYVKALPEFTKESSFAAIQARPPVEASVNTAQIEQLHRVPHLSSFSKKEMVEFLSELQRSSPSQRKSLLLKYSTLAGLPIQQKEVLLEQLSNIVPVTTKPNMLACRCKNSTKYEMCVREDCEQRSVLLSICDKTCGSIGHTSAVCISSEQCSAK